jgi:long-chain acyl-CoA synthetase
MMLTLTPVRSIGEALRDTVVTHKTNVALIEVDRHRENGRWTYRELAAQARRFAASIQGVGFVGGDRCAIVMQNQSKWIFTAIGAFWAGAVVVPIDYKLTAPEQLALLAHCRPRVLVTEYSTWRKLQDLDLAPLSDTHVLVTEAPADADLGGAHRWEAEPTGEFRPVDRVRQDIACIVYSSGTSGAPKGCMLTHDNYLEQAQALGRLFPIEEDDRYFSVLPTNHAIDFMVGFLVPLMFGAAIVHQRTLRPQFLRSTMKEYGITHMALVPTILKNLRKRIEERLDDLPDWQRRVVDAAKRANGLLTARRPNQRLSSALLRPIHRELGGKLQLLFAGGSFIDRDLADFFYDLGIPVVIGYGLTEATTVVTVNDLEPYRGDTVGKVVEGVEIELRNSNDEGIGEVWVRGRTVMAGYLDAPEATAETIVDGWLRTGDLGKVDISGHLKLVGRSKNMIVTEGGKNIYPEDVEATFEDIDGIDEFCVFAANYVWPVASMTGEMLVVVIHPEDGQLTDETLQEVVARNRKLADYKRIGGYVVLDEDFPRTASLKIKRSDLAARIAVRSRDEAIRPLGE